MDSDNGSITRKDSWVNEILCKRVAALAIGGRASVSAIAKELNTSASVIKKIMASDRYAEVVKKETDGLLSNAVFRLKEKMFAQAETALQVIDKAMQEYLAGNGGAREAMEASKIVLRAQGLDAPEEKKNDTQINVILPAGVNTKVIDAEKLEIEETYVKN